MIFHWKWLRMFIANIVFHFDFLSLAISLLSAVMGKILLIVGVVLVGFGCFFFFRSSQASSAANKLEDQCEAAEEFMLNEKEKQNPGYESARAKWINLENRKARKSYSSWTSMIYGFIAVGIGGTVIVFGSFSGRKQLGTRETRDSESKTTGDS